jgi:hypothetical protein
MANENAVLATQWIPSLQLKRAPIRGGRFPATRARFPPGARQPSRDLLTSVQAGMTLRWSWENRGAGQSAETGQATELRASERRPVAPADAPIGLTTTDVSEHPLAVPIPQSPKVILLANSEPGADQVSMVARNREIDLSRGLIWPRLKGLDRPARNSTAVSKVRETQHVVARRGPSHAESGLAGIAELEGRSERDSILV